MGIPVSGDSLTLSDGRAVTLLELLGRGSLGAVYRGLVEGAFGVRRPVAVKLFDVLSEDEDAILRHLATTARRAACVGHAAVVQTFDLDRAEGRMSRAFVVTELVDGEPLRALLETWRYDRQRVPLDFALVVAMRTAEALGAALFSEVNEGGVTALPHGDLSPRQILVSSRGDVKVSDFGQNGLRELAARPRSRDRLAFTAPEVACGYAPDPRADVFSLGVILHEMLVGPRFAPHTSAAEAVQIVREGIVPTSCMNPTLPHGLREILDRALAAHPNDRYLHAQAFAADLRREMSFLNLVDPQTCVRRAVVGWSAAPERPMRTSDITQLAIDPADLGPETRREGARRAG